MKRLETAEMMDSLEATDMKKCLEAAQIRICDGKRYEDEEVIESDKVQKEI